MITKYLLIPFLICHAASSSAQWTGLDGAFNGTGYQHLQHPIGSAALCAASDAEGRTVVGGYVFKSDWTTQLLVVRILSDGGFDPEFSEDGLDTLDLPGGESEARKILIQPDGRILLLSSTVAGSVHLIRYLSNGTLDPEFGNAGVTTVGGLNHSAKVIHVLADSKIIVAGIREGPPLSNDLSTFVLKLNADGSIDGNFGVAGWLEFDLDPLSVERPMHVCERPGGGLILMGNLITGLRKPHYFLRLDEDGSPDDSFGDQGLVVDSLGLGSYMVGSSLSLLPNGEMLVGGNVEMNDTVFVAVTLFQSDGSVNTAWGDMGCMLWKTPGSAYNILGGMVQLGDGSWVIGGHSSSLDQLLNRHFYCHLPANPDGLPYDLPPQAPYLLSPELFGAQFATMLDGVLLGVNGNIIGVTCARFALLDPTLQLTVYRLGPSSVGGAETDHGPSFVVQPNPVNDAMYVRFQGESGSPVRLELIDVHGRTVYVFPPSIGQRSVASELLSWPRHFPSGVYLIDARNASWRGAVRVVKE